MRKRRYYPHISLILLLLVLLSLPRHTAENIRAFTISCIAPSWHGFQVTKTALVQALTFFPKGTKPLEKSTEFERLKLENTLLRSELEKLTTYFLLDKELHKQLHLLQQLTSKEEKNLFWQEFFKRRAQELSQKITLHLQSLPAQVVFRSPLSWSHSLWINVGEKDNTKLGLKIIGKNSPVVIGNTLVGVIEEVEKSRSRVRLLTDASLTPSVRALRHAQDFWLLEHLDPLILGIQTKEFSNPQEKETLLKALSFFKQSLNPTLYEQYRAKGELRGSSSSSFLRWGHIPLLKGVGFNYDYADAEGPAQDLYQQSQAPPLLQKGDLLVTTGLDGVFPAGLSVAIVTHIYPLQEGACTYELDAFPTAGNLNELSHVWVLPPLDSTY